MIITHRSGENEKGSAILTVAGSIIWLPSEKGIKVRVVKVFLVNLIPKLISLSVTRSLHGNSWLSTHSQK